MSCAGKITELIFEAMREYNATAEPGRTLEIAEGTILVGETGKLDSLGFVNLVATIEENIEGRLHRTVSVMDLILGLEGAEWTVAGLAARLAEILDAELAARN